MKKMRRVWCVCACIETSRMEAKCLLSSLEPPGYCKQQITSTQEGGHKEMPIKPNPSNATTPTAISNLSFCPTPRARPTQPSPSQSLLNTGSGERAISQPCDGPGNPIHPALNPTRSPFFSPSLPFPFLFFSCNKVIRDPRVLFISPD